MYEYMLACRIEHAGTCVIPNVFGRHRADTILGTLRRRSLISAQPEHTREFARDLATYTIYGILYTTVDYLIFGKRVNY